MDLIELAQKVAFRLLGKPYNWGGDDPMVGFDCSGFIVEVLKSCGRLPRRGDWTADSLMHYGFPETTELVPGVLVFWGSTRATHVEMIYGVLDGIPLTIGAAGGDSSVVTVQDAVGKNAYIMLRPMRAGSIALRDPFAAYRP